jgi:hypothetical protein
MVRQLKPRREPMRMLTPRVTRSQHAELVEEAGRLGVSLNALYVYRLTCPLDEAAFASFLEKSERRKAPAEPQPQPAAELQAPAKCARTMCSRPHDGCRHTIDTERLYCWDCSRRINEHYQRDYPQGLITIPITARQTYLDHVRAAAR